MAEVHAVAHAAPVAPSREPQRVDLEQVVLDPAAASVLPLAIARRHHVVPIGRRFGTPVVAMADPHDLVAVDTLRATLGRDFIAVVGDPGQIEQCIERVYCGGPPVGGPLSKQIAARAAPGVLGSPAAAEPEPLPVAPHPSPEPPEALQPPRPPEPPEALQPPRPPEPLQPPEPLPSLGHPTPATPAPAAPAGPSGAVPPLAPSAVHSPAEASPGTVAHAAGTTEPELPMPPMPEMPEMVVEPPEVPGVDEPASALATALHVDDASLPPLARVLVEGKRVPLEVMREVLEERERTGMAITRILTNRGLVTEADLMWGMAQEMGLEFVDLDLQAVDFASAYALPEATARHHNVLLVGYSEDGTPVVAASNPTDVFAMDDLRTILGRNFTIVVATRSQINTYLDRAYTQGGDAREVAASAASDFTESDEDLAGLQAVVDDAPIVRYVNLLILQALNERASDIHVEPTDENLRIRYRIDGVLHDISTAPRAIAGAVTTRLKVMADINIAEHRIPQDGRISLNVGSRQIDLRIATLPTIHGEKVVMRVLDKSNVVLGFEDLGFDADLLELYEKVYTKPYGTILVTGPTGSGKTTTLYATLAALNFPDRNIITVEDPVELRIKGINQVQLNVKAGLTFASALRSILRSDPDILLVGEIRDRETALISVEAALTGHLVLATLHTNSAAATPMRLVEMGLEPYLVTSALSAALAQRLIRRLCVHCREPFEATEAAIVSAGWSPEEVFARDAHPVLYRAVGCSACSKTGYRGRKALLELLVVTDEIERLIVEGGTSDDIHAMAVEQGMVTLRQRGLRKALEGETTLEEVLRVVA